MNIEVWKEKIEENKITQFATLNPFLEDKNIQLDQNKCVIIEHWKL